MEVHKNEFDAKQATTLLIEGLTSAFPKIYADHLGLVSCLEHLILIGRFEKNFEDGNIIYFPFSYDYNLLWDAFKGILSFFHTMKSGTGMRTGNSTIILKLICSHN